jgi:DNA invertase Pin-like site-specific DNA recombinase
MALLPSTHKIRPEHLERLALVYIRQSTMIQVREHTASQARQYDLVQRAVDLGWDRENVVVIDQDQGRSGASAADRDGFQCVVAEVGLGRAGAVLSLEASRLARSCSDWYRLIEICALADTLVIDEEGVYDPSQYNDRLLLGFKGTMSEAELHWLHNRLQGGKLRKAQDGELRCRLPAGFIYDDDKKIIFDPDEQVQHAVRLVFDLFDELGSAFKVVKYFSEHHLLLPTRVWTRDRKGELDWKPPRLSRVLHMLHNPAYAGAYVYGRSKTRTRLLPSEPTYIKGRTTYLKRDEWPIVLYDVHPAYITWEQFLRHEQQLDDNRVVRHDERRGAVREGPALLQGIALCGRCGRRMNIRYLDDGTVPCYCCRQLQSQYARKRCQSIRGDGIDAAVADALLEAMQPAQLEVSMAALEQIEARARQIDRQWQLRIEHAQYEANLARRRFFAVDPENRLVARTLERDWNDKLEQVQRVEREYAALPRPTLRLASPEERQRILALAQDLPAIWHAPTTTHTERKQLLRCLIKDVTLTKRDENIHIGIRWQTETVTELEIPRPKLVFELRVTDPNAVERIRELASTHTDRQIAAILNQEDFLPAQGGSFTRKKIQSIRYQYHIPTGCPDFPAARLNGRRGDGRYSTKAAAELLNVDRSTIIAWCKSGRLDGIQAVPRSYWWVKLTPEDIARLQRPEKPNRSDHSPK